MTLPLTVVTLGLFIFVLNATMFALVAAMLNNFQVAGFWSALFGAIIVSITSTVESWYIGPDGRYDVFVVRRRQSNRRIAYDWRKRVEWLPAKLMMTLVSTEALTCDNPCFFRPGVLAAPHDCRCAGRFRIRTHTSGR